jgi:16S rRNA (uracil1498-N3)-methyltransferase
MLPPGGGRVTLSAGAARHARVLRLSARDRIRLFDGRGAEADAVVVVVGERLECEVSPPEIAAGDGPRIALILGVPKGAKLDTVVRATTELGVASIHLALCERSVARPGGERAAARVERLERVAREASRQSCRATVPLIVPPAPLADVAERARAGDARLVFCGAADARLESDLGAPEVAWLAVGPEGGLSPEEVAFLCRKGFFERSLGPTTLRVETAAVVAVALIADRLAIR